MSPPPPSHVNHSITALNNNLMKASKPSIPVVILKQLGSEYSSSELYVNSTADIIVEAFRLPTGPPTDKNLSDDVDVVGRKIIAHRYDSKQITPALCKYALPTYLLYDSRGLQLFDAITHLPEYYLTQCEADILSGPASMFIADQILPGTVIVELGCGSMRKTKHLLDAIELSARLRGGFHNHAVRFYALDLDCGELEKSLAVLQASPPPVGVDNKLSNETPQKNVWQHITFHGLVGTYDQCITALRTLPELAFAPCRIVLWLGSSIGNYTRDEAQDFLSQLQKNMDINRNDRIVLGVDGRNEPNVIELAYNDAQGITREFELNILNHINKHLRIKVPNYPIEPFPLHAFEYAPVYNTSAGRHEAYLRAIRDIDVFIPEMNLNVSFTMGELIHIEHSYKYNLQDTEKLLNSTNLGIDVHWTDPSDKYSLYLLASTPFSFYSNPITLNTGIPSVNDWCQIWIAFDTISLKLIKTNALHLRPIHVRHPTCFYIGHLPCFADIQLSRVLNQLPLGSDLFQRIFERGMDPDLDDPSICHPHSEVPDQWPELTDITEYRDRVRDRIRLVMSQLDTIDLNLIRKIESTLCMIFEHDIMHLETLLYMIQQLPMETIDTFAAKIPQCQTVTCTKPPTLLSPVPTTIILTEKITLGRSRSDPNDSKAVFGWDNEFPERVSERIEPLEVQTRPVSVAEYALFLDSISTEKVSQLIPSKWRYNHDKQSWEVRSLPHGGWLSISINEQSIGNWPVTVSCIMAQAYSTWWNMNIERGILSNGKNDNKNSNTPWRIPVESELRIILNKAQSEAGITNGISLGRYAPSPMRTDVNCPWTPIGNVWEWTSSVFSEHEGFKPDERYPGYSKDFFDGKHSVVLGGSWATHPRLTCRSTFRNWYQNAYPYAEIGFRLVRSIS